MGCDIHLHIEVKIEDRWHHYAALSPRRSYDMFTRMANVRGEHEDAPDPEGLPDDITFLTAYNAQKWAADGHSHSWMGLDEIQALEKHYTQTHLMRSWFEEWVGTYLFGNGFELDPEHHPNMTDIRFVFWFDN